MVIALIAVSHVSPDVFPAPIAATLAGWTAPEHPS